MRDTIRTMLSRHSFCIAIDAVAWVSTAAAANRPATAYTYTLVTEPDQGITPIYNFIGTAKKTIDMTMYEFTDTTGEQLLAQAAAAGVTVRVILDQNQEKSSNTPAYNYLTANGVQVHWANPVYSVASSGGGSQLIVDGGFESATQSGNSAPGWTAATNTSGQDVIVYEGPYPHTGTNYASEGGYDNVNDTLTQTLTIPSGISSATLAFWVNVVTQETTTTTKYDYLYVEIHNTAGTKLATPLTLSNLDNKSSNDTNGVYFQPAAVNLAAYAGKTIELVFHATNDYEKTTPFRIDDVPL
jgi:hypothetical protein